MKHDALGANSSQFFGGVCLDANIVYAWQGRMPQIDIPASMFTSTAPGGLGLTQAQADQLAAVAQSGSLGILNARVALSFGPERNFEQIGRASCRDRVCQYV